MTQIILENLDPIVVEKLQVRATRQGRSLLEELKAIVEEAVEFGDVPAPQETMEAIFSPFFFANNNSILV
ncbi:hypothetical protein NIES2101_19275 [Calothrix sp. HK-06]|nr:hypothetical protein NIES2101_19275 [Calothrix sp. HK-06]